MRLCSKVGKPTNISVLPQTHRTFEVYNIDGTKRDVTVSLKEVEKMGRRVTLNAV